MSYTPQQWKNDNTDPPYGPLSGDRLDYIETGIAAVANELDAILAGVLVAPGDMVLGSDSAASGVGDVVFTTKGGVESLRLTNDGAIKFSKRFQRDDFSPAFGDAGSFFALRRHVTIPGGPQRTVDFQAQAHGTGGNGDFTYAVYAAVSDDSFVALTVPVVTGCADNGGGLIRVTCPGHGFSTDDDISVYGITAGTTEAVGKWTVTVIDVNTFDLQGSAFVHAYVSGGFATNRTGLYGMMSQVTLHQSRGGLGGTAVHGDDVSCYGARNASTNNSTAGPAFIVNDNTGFVGDIFKAGFQIEAQTTNGIVFVGDVSQYGVDFRAVGTADSIPSFGLGLMRLTNDDSVVGRNWQDNADVELFKIDTSNFFQVVAPLYAAESFGLSVTPARTQSGAGSATGYSAGTTAATFHSDDKYTGHIGSTGYTINGIVAALKIFGFLSE